MRTKTKMRNGRKESNMEEFEYETIARMEYMGEGMYRVVWVIVHLETEEESEYVGPVAPTAQEAVVEGLKRLDTFIQQVRERTVTMPEGEVWDDPLDFPLSVDEDMIRFVVGWFIGKSTDDYTDVYDAALNTLKDIRTKTLAL